MLPPADMGTPGDEDDPGWDDVGYQIGDVVPMTTGYPPPANIPRIEQVEDPGEDEGDPTSTDPSSYYTPPAWTPPLTTDIPIA